MAGFLRNGGTVLYLASLVEALRGPFGGQRNHTLTPSDAKAPEMVRLQNNCGSHSPFQSRDGIRNDRRFPEFDRPAMGPKL